MTKFSKGDWVELTRNTSGLVEGMRGVVTSTDYAWREVTILGALGATWTLNMDTLKKCEKPAVGDYVIFNTTFTGSPSWWKDPHAPRKIVRILDDFVVHVEGGPLVGSGLSNFCFVNIKTYEPPPPPRFKNGEIVVLPEDGEESIRRNLGAATLTFLQNQELTIFQSGWSKMSGHLYVVRDASGRSINLYESYAKLLIQKPKDWKPREIPLDLDLLTVNNINLTTPSFGSCCGFRGLYGFYCLSEGFETTKGFLTGLNLAGQILPRGIRITPEIFKAVIRNHTKSHDETGVIFAILATHQIETYGPLLEECGFTKIKEYPNLNHGTKHMNAMYGYFCHEQRQAKKVVEKKRAFG